MSKLRLQQVITNFVVITINLLKAFLKSRKKKTIQLIEIIGFSCNEIFTFVLAKSALLHGIRPIIIDNTNIFVTHMKPYINLVSFPSKLPKIPVLCI